MRTEKSATITTFLLIISTLGWGSTPDSACFSLSQMDKMEMHVRPEKTVSLSNGQYNIFVCCPHDMCIPFEKVKSGDKGAAEQYIENEIFPFIKSGELKADGCHHTFLNNVYPEITIPARYEAEKNLN